MQSLHNTYCSPGSNVRYILQAEPVKLDIDTAIPLGLITNELVTNAYKYAFTENNGGIRELQYHVIGIASDYEEVGKILSSRVPDIALLDIHLQRNEDGITLALAIRERFDIPVVFISSYSDRKTVERAKQARPEGYIVKPFT